MLLFDAHTHLNTEGMSESESVELVSRIEDSDIAYVADSGYNLTSSELVIAHAALSSKCLPCVGLHPLYVCDDMHGVLEDLDMMAASPSVRAIGEIGLDYHLIRKDRSREREKDVQQAFFREQIAIALRRSLPVIVHDRDAHGDTFDLLLREGAFSGSGLMMHSYSGSMDQALEYIKRGAMISLSAVVTYPGSRKARELASNIPLDALLVETDAPFLSPYGKGDGRSEAFDLPYIIEAVAKLRGLSPEHIAEATYKNAMRFFQM